MPTRTSTQGRPKGEYRGAKRDQTHRATLAGPRVYLRPPRHEDEPAFLEATRASRSLHGPWTRPPETRARYRAFVETFGSGARAVTRAGYLLCRRDDHELLGVFNFSEIVRGAFRSTYLGYFGFAPHSGHGYMTEGMALALAGRIGFTREGFSRRYVKIAGRWRDHVRYAMLAEDWRALRRAHLGRRERSS